MARLRRKERKKYRKLARAYLTSAAVELREEGVSPKTGRRKFLRMVRDRARENAESDGAGDSPLLDILMKIWDAIGPMLTEILIGILTGLLTGGIGFADEE